MPATHDPRTPRTTRRTGTRRWAPALLVTAVLAACGASTDAAESRRQPSEAQHRAAMAAANRYVELQLDRAEEARR